MLNNSIRKEEVRKGEIMGHQVRIPYPNFRHIVDRVAEGYYSFLQLFSPPLHAKI